MTFLRHVTPALALALAACGSHTPGAGEPGGAGGNAPPPVSVVAVREEPLSISAEFPGRTVAYETSDVRPQVNGLIQARLFTEGEFVRAGQPLYRIDPAPYQAQVSSARAALTKAQATIASTEALARRYGELVKINAIARQDYENAVASAGQARADVAAQQAALRTAQIDLGRTTIRAPISGRIGRSLTTTGGLVSASQTTALTTIQRIDPVYVDIPQSSADLLKLRRQIMDGKLTKDGKAKVQLILEDGSTYPLEGDLLFTDVTVDQATGSQVLRAVFPNPRSLLLPGMFVRAKLVQGTVQNAIALPQQALTRDEHGNAVAMVVGAQNKVEQRQIQTGGTQGDKWIVTGGLRSGDKVIVEGGMMLQPGMAVTPQPWNPNAPAAQPAAAAKGK
ncbi:MULTISPECIES: efflux RND transporter periplasmic adaptor subunit [unclassified Novosphingobium]|uniref:efflux RND transporter periplasmic adaptor subunit n=1 Tax=unclassified Novosphingobium TaxID=2644732 RepID=UPI0014461F62|nr:MULTISPECIES: efflux RND transporter periplasmic adaptor subunit [unclassified Novosphingobium]NKJ42104.1 membrane fusion protein (multidrug efflux system) [Novosphingobium sp. SG720]NMN04493.1 membrane fusion protein (multidrug efflux system) [Novosphingobium sp. SG919]NMN85515.1 membrane fusion protein (multidrug efflux system) [Novosphingobium sp. SG916]